MKVIVKNISILAMIAGLLFSAPQAVYSMEAAADATQTATPGATQSVTPELPIPLRYKKITEKTRDKKIEAGRIAFFEALGPKVFLKTFDPLVYTIKYVEYASLKDPRMVRRTVLNYSSNTVDEVLFQGAKGKGMRGLYQQLIESPSHKKADSRAEDHSLAQTYLDGFNMIWKFEKDADVVTFANNLHDVFEKAGVMPDQGNEPLLIIYSHGKSSELMVPERVNEFLNKYFTVIPCADMDLIGFILEQQNDMLEKTNDVYKHPKVTYVNDSVGHAILRGIDSEFMDFKPNYYSNKLTKKVAGKVGGDIAKLLVVCLITKGIYSLAAAAKDAVIPPKPEKPDPLLAEIKGLRADLVAKK